MSEKPHRMRRILVVIALFVSMSCGAVANLGTNTSAIAASQGGTLLMPTWWPPYFANGLGQWNAPLNLGVRATTSSGILITRVLFAKDSLNTGSHTAFIWNAAGTVIGQQAFVNETSSGWQEVVLDTPVAIASGSTFTVGYSTDGVSFPFGDNWLTKSIGPITILSGYSIYTNVAGAFPNATNGSNYGVDFEFTVAAVPANSVIPSISGTKRTGETLTASPGTWSGAPTSYAYQWKRASTSGGTYTNISSATNSTYVLTDSDIGKFIKVSVVATNANGSSTAELSAATTAISDLPDSATPSTSSTTSTSDGYTFTISNYSNLYNYSVSASSGSVSRSADAVTVSGLASSASSTVTISVTRSGYKPASATVSGTAAVATTTTTTTTTTPAALVIDLRTSTTIAAQGQASVATIASTVPAARTTTTTIAKSPSSSTSTTSTTMPAQTTTTVAIPQPGNVATGAASVKVGREVGNATISRENNVVVVKVADAKTQFASVDDKGNVVPLDGAGNIGLKPGAKVRIRADGFQTGTDVEVWLFSSPTKLGRAPVDAKGAVDATFTIPKNVPIGSHRIAVVANLMNGKQATFTLGIAVTNFKKGKNVTPWIIGIPLVLAVLSGVFLPPAVRKRKKKIAI